MKNIKKIIALVIAALMLAALASCSGTGTDNTTSPATGTADNTSKTYKVGICPRIIMYNNNRSHHQTKQ